MINSLLLLLVLETAEPSYNTIMALLPQNVAAQAAAQTLPDLRMEKSPVKTRDSIAPLIEAKSVFSIDLASGSPLFTRDIFTRRQMASIAKLMTAMVILDNHNLDEKIRVSRNAAEQTGSQMRLRPGEELTVENTLAGMLINSGNDAAAALAEYDAGNEKAFVKKMNEKAFALGLKDTLFSNAKGFDEENNYSTAFDIMIFSRAAWQYPFIKQTVGRKKAEAASADGKIKHALESTNELLEDPYFKILGLKTGSTPAAGLSFVSMAEGPNGHEILTIILDSPNRFRETKIFLDWAFRNFQFP